MTPKLFRWMLAWKNRRLTLTALPGPGGGSYLIELRQGLSVKVSREVNRLTVERYMGNNLIKILDEMTQEFQQKLEEEDEDDDE